MHLPIVSVRFGLMLEAYCRGCGETQMAALTSGLTALNKMEQVLLDTASQLWRKKPYMSYCRVQVTSHLQTLGKKKVEELLKCLRESHFITAMESIISPLDPMLHCKALA